MKRLPTKYLAGLIDGEGCIDFHLSHGSYLRPRLRISLVSHCKDILEMIQNTYKGKIYFKKSTNSNWQDVCNYELTGYKDVGYLLRNIKNFLHIKKEQAELILQLENSVRGKVVSDKAIRTIKEELKLMKKDSHRLSEKAVERILQML